MTNRQEPTRRTANACMRCKSRKSRCDGNTPRCGLCRKHGARCEYTERRMRGPGKGKQHIQRLEKRLEMVESAMQKSRSPPTDQEAAGPETGDLAGEDVAETSPVPQELTAANIQPDLSSYFLSKLPPPGTAAMIAAGHAQGCFQRTIFTPLPPKVAAQSMILNSLQDMCRAWPLFDAQSVRDMIDQQFEAGPADCHNSPTRWAILNALLAMATQWKAANPLAKDVFPISWTYLKNAYAVVPELSLQPTNTQACRALLIVVLFLHLSADSLTSTILLSTVTTMAKAFGLHCEDSIELEQRRRLFWLTHILNNQAAMRYGSSPTYNDDQTEVELPNQNRLIGDIGPATTDTLRPMAELSLIQTRVHTLLRSIRSSLGGSEELTKSLAKIDTSLCKWRTGLPKDLQCPTSGESAVTELEPGAILLHFESYATRWAMHSGVHSLEKGSGPEGPFPEYHFVAQLSSCWLSQAFKSGARETLVLFASVPTQPFAWFWNMLCYPVCAFLILLREVLDDPYGDEAASNLVHMLTFVQGLEDWKQKEGYEIQKVAKGCSKLLVIASFATSCPRSMTSSTEMNTSFGLPGMSTQFETLRERLRGTIDFMHLSQGLMSNMPIPHALAKRTFSGILDLPTDPADTFGAFVPEILKPRTYNFFYGPT